MYGLEENEPEAYRQNLNPRTLNIYHILPANKFLLALNIIP